MGAVVIACAVVAVGGVVTVVGSLNAVLEEHADARGHRLDLSR